MLVVLLSIALSEGGFRVRRRRRGSCPVRNCSVSSWGRWGACSASCGPSGIKTRSRTKFSSEQCGGRCGTLTQTRSCNRRCCPSPCKYSYSAWTECFGCGTHGMRSRILTITQQPACGAPLCPRAGPYIGICDPKR